MVRLRSAAAPPQTRACRHIDIRKTDAPARHKDSPGRPHVLGRRPLVPPATPRSIRVNRWRQGTGAAEHYFLDDAALSLSLSFFLPALHEAGETTHSALALHCFWTRSSAHSVSPGAQEVQGSPHFLSLQAE